MDQVFAQDSTFLLMKKFMIYKLMSSNLFINHALTGMNFCYKVFGIRLTNFIINKSAGEVFTSGSTVNTLLKDIEGLKKKNVHGIGNYVVEGLPTMDQAKIDFFHKEMMESIH